MEGQKGWGCWPHAGGGSQQVEWFQAGETVRLTLFTEQIWTREITSSLLRHPPSVIPLLGEGEGVIGESRTPIDSLWGCHSASPAVQTRLSCEFELPIRPNVRFACHRVPVHLRPTDLWLAGELVGCPKCLDS